MDNDTRQIADIEAIKALKARYFRTMDTRDWDGLAACFTEDLRADFRDAPGMLSEGREAYMEALTAALAEARTVHHGHMPEITLLDEHNATGIWAMYDYLEGPEGYRMEGWGHYHETYRKGADDRWQISSTRLTRLRIETPNRALRDALWPEGPSLMAKIRDA